LKTGWSNWGT